jgi:hypothetical protein
MFVALTFLALLASLAVDYPPDSIPRVRVLICHFCVSAFGTMVVNLAVDSRADFVKFADFSDDNYQ